MTRKRHSDKDVLNLLRESALKLTTGDNVASACRKHEISDANFCKWRPKYAEWRCQTLVRAGNSTFSSMTSTPSP